MPRNGPRKAQVYRSFAIFRILSELHALGGFNDMVHVAVLGFYLREVRFHYRRTGLAFFAADFIAYPVSHDKRRVSYVYSPVGITGQ